MSFWPSTGGERILLVFDLVVGFFLAVAIHEAAHALVGVCAGLSFNSLRVGPLQIDRHFRISLNRDNSMMQAGWAIMTPVKTDALAWRKVVITAAGPAANLISGITVLLLPFTMGPFSFSFVIASLYQGVQNLLPLHRGPILTDGMEILRLLRSCEQRERFVAMAKLAAEIKKGVPMEDLSPDLLAKAVAIKDNSPDTVLAYSLASAAAYYQHDDTRAAEYLETCLQYSPYAAPRMQQVLMSDAGELQARKRKRVDLAEQWLAAMPGKTEIPWLRAMVEAAILEAKGDIDGALKQLEAIEKVVLRAPDQAQRERAQRSLLKWKSELLPRVVSTPEADKQR